MVAKTLWSFLCGVLAVGIVLTTVGLLGEERLFPTAALNDAADSLALAGVFTLAVIGWPSILVITIARGLHEIGVSRAVQRAAQSGAARTAVPHPSQVEKIIAPGFGAFIWFAGATLALAGFFLLIGLFAVLSAPDTVGLLIVGSGLIALALLGVTIGWLVKRVRPAQRERRARNADHWSRADEQDAWQQARGSQDQLQRQTAMRGNVLTGFGSSCAGVALIAVQLLLIVTHPDRQRWPGGTLGRRVQLDDRTEQIVSLGYWSVLVLTVLAVVAIAAGGLLAGSRETSDRAALERDVAAHGEPDLDLWLIQRYCEPRPVLLAQWLATFAGVCLCASLSLIVVSLGFLDAAHVQTGLNWPFALIAVCSVLLLVVALVWNARSVDKGRALRNALISRWPIAPDPKPNDEDESNPARVGPALTPQ